MIILDTNVISEFAKQSADRSASLWLRRQKLDELCTCAPVVAELWFGGKLTELRTGSRRYLESFRQVVDRALGGRVLPFDHTAAIICAEIRASSIVAGRTRQPNDAMIAAICLANGAMLATRNVRDFEGLDLKLANPFEAA